MDVFGAIVLIAFIGILCFLAWKEMKRVEEYHRKKMITLDSIQRFCDCACKEMERW